MTDEKRAKPPASTFVSPEGLAVLAAAGATAALASLPIVIVPGVLAYGILTYLRVERWRDTASEAEFAPVVPSAQGLLPHHAQRVGRSVALQKQILREIQTGEASHRAMLTPNIARVRGLVESTATLTRRLQDIEVHLKSDDSRRAQNVAQDLEHRMRSTQDASARDGYGRALEQQREKLRVYGELKARGDRLDAQLATIELTLETVVAQILRIKSAEPTAAVTETERVAEALQNISIDVEALAETVDETSRDPYISGTRGSSK